MAEDAGRDTRRRLTVTEAADQLGVTVDAIRSRVKRGTIDHTRQGGRVYVLLGTDEARPGHDQHTDQGGGQATEDRTAELIATLQAQRQAEREANRENRRIIVALTSRIPELEAPVDNTPDAPGSPERGEEQQGRGTVPTEPQTATSRRPWWRRVFGG